MDIKQIRFKVIVNDMNQNQGQRANCLRKLIDWAEKIFMRRSHLSTYGPLVKQNLMGRVRRLYDDHADLKQHRFNKHIRKELLIRQIVDSHHNQIQSHHHNTLLECIDPCKPYLVLWYILILATIFYYFFQTTIMIAYGDIAWRSELKSEVVTVVNWISIIILIGDIFFQFEVGFIRRGMIVTNRFRVIDRYMRFYIFGDIGLIAILMLSAGTRHYTFHYFKMLILIKVLRVKEINSLIARMLLIHKFSRLVYAIARQLVLTILFAHIIGISFYMIDHAQLATTCQGQNYQLCWLNSSNAYSPIISLSWEWQYFYSIYWGINIVCMIAYGDIAPSNPIETAYATACFITCLVFISYIIKQIVFEIGVFIDSKEEYRDQVMMFSTFMDLIKLKNGAEQEIKDFLYDRYANSESDFDPSEMIERLPEKLKMEYYLDAYQRFFHGISFFFQMETSLIPLLYSIKEVTYASGEVIFGQGMDVDKLYYLFKGALRLTTFYGGCDHILNTIECPSSFFLAIQFVLREKSPFNIYTSTNSLIYSIDRSILDSKCQNDGEFKQKLCVLAYEVRHQKQLHRLFYSCFYCYKNHYWNECPLIFINFRGSYLNLNPDEPYNRLTKVKHRTWRDYKKLKKFNSVMKRNQDYMFDFLERKMCELRARAKIEREELEVDCYHQWKFFLEKGNLSCLRKTLRKDSEERDSPEKQ